MVKRSKRRIRKRVTKRSKRRKTKHSKRRTLRKGGSKSRKRKIKQRGGNMCSRTEEGTGEQQQFDKHIFDEAGYISISAALDEREGGQITTITSDGADFVMPYMSTLGTGSYGTVMLYTNEHIRLAIKFEAVEAVEEDRAPSEKIIAERLTAARLADNECVKKGIIDVRWLGTVDVRAIFKGQLAEKMTAEQYHLYAIKAVDGNLKDYLIRERVILTCAIAYKIASNIYNSIKCLWEIDNAFIYTDIKLINILISSTGDQPCIYLGDLGSAQGGEDGEYICTYPPPELNSPYYKISDNNDPSAIFAWGYGILLLSLIDNGKSVEQFNYAALFGRILFQQEHRGIRPPEELARIVSSVTRNDGGLMERVTGNMAALIKISDEQPYPHAHIDLSRRRADTFEFVGYQIREAMIQINNFYNDIKPGLGAYLHPDPSQRLRL
jgi:serine/threonine protein kinase